MKYILMHRELPVAVLSINDTSGTVYRVEDVVQPAHLPIGLFSADRREFAKNLNLWLAGRTIPASHSGFHHALEALQIQKKTTTIRQYLDDEVFCTKSVRSILAQSCRAALGMAQGQLLP